jgi:hypothetical protein
MALTTKQRAALPSSAFAYPSQRKYPVPTKAQAQRAGITERQRVGIHRAALSRSAQTKTSGSYRHVSGVVAKRSGGKVTPKNVSQGRQKRLASRGKRT